VAVIGCTPAERVEVDNFAVPTLSAALPIDFPLSENVTVPVAVEGVTAAVNVTVCPLTEGFRLEASVVAVEALFTACASVADVLVP
jgi:ribosomal protein S5